MRRTKCFHCSRELPPGKDKYCSRHHSNRAREKRKAERKEAEIYGNQPDPHDLGWWCPQGGIQKWVNQNYWNPDHVCWGGGFGPERPPQKLKENEDGIVKICGKFSDRSNDRRIMGRNFRGGKVCYTKEEAEERLAFEGYGQIYKCEYTPSDIHWHYSKREDECESR